MSVDLGPTLFIICWPTGTARIVGCSQERLRSASGGGMGPKPVSPLSFFRYSVCWAGFSFNKGLKESTPLARHSLIYVLQPFPILGYFCTMCLSIFRSRKGLPMATTKDCALVRAVLKTYGSQMPLVGLRLEPSFQVGSVVLMKQALNSSPVRTYTYIKLWLQPVYCFTQYLAYHR